MHTFIYAYYICIYNNKSRFSTGVKTFWVVQNNRPVIDATDKLSKRNKAKSVFNFDFSALHTKLSHAKLLRALHKLIDFNFNSGEHLLITISKFGENTCVGVSF